MGRAVPGERSVVLVVEDEVLIRLMAEDIVREAGFHAIGASGADEAIRILEGRSDIGVVFTDIQMAGSMDGLGLVEVIRDRWPDIAVVVTSGRHNGHHIDLPSRARFLPKPYQSNQVAAALRELIKA